MNWFPSYSLAKMIDTTAVESMIPVSVTMTFIQGHRVMKKAEILQFSDDMHIIWSAAERFGIVEAHNC